MTAAAQTSHRRVLFASLVGTSVEFYDFYIYSTAAALVFGDLFFPKASPTAQQMLAYATAGVAFVARPVGGLFFGHFGDRIGRKSTLVASLLTMGLSTLLVAFLPTYAGAGYLAPLALCLLRFGQGFGLGGEWSGAALLAVEHAPPGWRARYGIVPQLGAPVGFIAANGLFLLLSTQLSPVQFHDWGWRIPFAFSVVMVGIGLWIRLSLTETPEFAAALAEAPPPRVPLAEVIGRHGGILVAGTVATIACFLLYYLSTVFVLGYGTKTLHYSMAEMLVVELIAITCMAASILASGWLADRKFDERAVLMFGCVGSIAAGFALAPMLNAGLGGVLGFLCISQVLMGLVYGPLGAWLPGLFPPRVRYTGASAAFNIAGVLGGGLTPIVAQKLTAMGGLAYVGYYASGAAALSLIALLMVRARK